VQLNLTARCNLACTHCHVESSPMRSETMDERAAARVVTLLDASPGVGCLDLTGGAPELAPVFRPLVEAGRERGLEVIDRCNLTVLLEPGQEGTARFLAQQGVRVVASLPCYEPENVDGQRGRSVFARSVEALRTLNELGYARPGSGLELDLVYNPVGAQLPPPAPELEARFRSELRQRHGLEFDRLLVLTNMPIRRWAGWLRRRGEYEGYLDLLEQAFNPDALARVMCRELVSVSWDGSLYDCDFNQQLGMALGGAGRRTLWDLASFDELGDAPIAMASHCLGCTANTGSSCGGTLL
jgi:radical SAM/Cys-rich protein